MNIHSLQIEPSSDTYYLNSFMNVLDDHIQYLLKLQSTKTINVEPVYANKYQGDFSGLLTHYSIPMQYHWVIMRMNSFTSFNDSNSELKLIYVPDYDEIERLRQTFRTTRNKIKT